MIARLTTYAIGACLIAAAVNGEVHKLKPIEGEKSPLEDNFWEHFVESQQVDMSVTTSVPTQAASGGVLTAPPSSLPPGLFPSVSPGVLTTLPTFPTGFSEIPTTLAPTPVATGSITDTDAPAASKGTVTAQPTIAGGVATAPPSGLSKGGVLTEAPSGKGGVSKVDSSNGKGGRRLSSGTIRKMRK